MNESIQDTVDCVNESTSSSLESREKNLKTSKLSFLLMNSKEEFNEEVVKTNTQ